MLPIVEDITRALSITLRAAPAGEFDGRLPSVEQTRNKTNVEFRYQAPAAMIGR
jgi:hypothetical protein